MFSDELLDDLPVLQRMVDDKQFEQIREFEHKYKMRLDYFGFGQALELCKAIGTAYHDGQPEMQLKHTQAPIESLRVIAIELNDTKGQ